MDDQSDMTQPFDSFLVTEKHDPSCIATFSNIPHVEEVLIIYPDAIPPAAPGAEPTADPMTSMVESWVRRMLNIAAA